MACSSCGAKKGHLQGCSSGGGGRGGKTGRRCGKTLVLRVPGKWHNTHTCLVELEPGKDRHPGAHVCTCGWDWN